MVLARARQVAEQEKHKFQELAEGKLIPDWLADTLRQKGCEIVEDVFDEDTAS